ncbi:2-succinyl-5-enolpyruvyl-6-hydroxy-3-cyclohexene-1-carboxylate synthase [Maribacter vaceletii]|uniref:2-succinyl-5-enolpyruvyl-6-hydroxy-3-cyclohexene-1-carboxylate synthase n=1 Tax=Maribacter vaceletii TaxID=1206816 RepID=A0A495E7K9_9FLAO|nr:2-succinyl-5-enolpyruvyl-6-hydroxy-3-cyclohexene-1-carboxylic-acid synthase [Maribacter vaceletii]RKR12920.1 2-succinyl-5-enolpyruvyl-6-hydroxy-3-cyclohexene-1-carboxylate synthase [Maribacter vaceletii]
MKYSTIASAQTIILHCKAKGIKNIVISPGSRNAPLTISFTENTFFNCYSIVDERCAAFFALGMAQQLKEPVVVVCTSGSALLNYYPAIAEAYYSGIPLVVISADRPTYKVDVGDGQTIRQTNVFNNHIGYSANLKQDANHASEVYNAYELNIDVQDNIQTYNDAELNTALNTAIHLKLPVHINIPFEEPLYNKVSKPSVVPNIIFDKKNDRKPNNIEFFKEKWSSAERIIVLVGVNEPNAIDQELLDALGVDSRIIVFTETTSNLHHPNFFPSIDSILAPIEKSNNKEELFKNLQPEILVTFGGLVVSKKIKAFLRSYKPSEHWHIDKLKALDTYFSLSNHIKEKPSFFLKSIVNSKNNKSNYFDFWNAKRNQYQLKRKEYLCKIPFSDFKVFDIILKSIPNNYQLQLANSSTIRYTQLFNNNKTIPVFCNRGTSGIDGSVSTAVGASIYYSAPTLLITGDLSFFYDSNGLWNNYLRKDFKIIVVNNGGGGIFRILPGKEDSKMFNTFFETQNNLSAKEICKLYNLEYLQADVEYLLEEQLKKMYKITEKPAILEIKTPRLINDKILIDYFDFIS